MDKIHRFTKNKYFLITLVILATTYTLGSVSNTTTVSSQHNAHILLLLLTVLHI
jgi:hypothetical protein